MGTGVYKRIAGYLKGLFGSGEVRLVSIEGGKRRDRRDVERERRHRAVIGIPYSTDRPDSVDGEEKKPLKKANIL